MKASWFVSPPGRRLSKALAYAATSGGFLMYYLPNTLLIDTYQAVTHQYRNGTPVRISEKMSPLVEEVMNDLQMSKEQKNLLTIYAGYGFDLFRAGSLALLSSKVVLGIPSNFRYENIQQFDPSGIAIKHEPVMWSSPAAESLKESLVFSYDAKKFAIARELTLMNSAEPFINGVFTSSILFMCYIISSSVNSKLNFYVKGRPLRIIWYSLMSLFSCTMWILCKDVSCVSSETKAEEAVANISEKYAKGGLEFYEKTLQRNKALRSLMGTDGEALFTAYGNDEVVIRTKHLPFTTRHDYMKARIEEYQKSHEDSS